MAPTYGRILPTKNRAHVPIRPGMKPSSTSKHITKITTDESNKENYHSSLDFQPSKKRKLDEPKDDATKRAKLEATVLRGRNSAPKMACKVEEKECTQPTILREKKNAQHFRSAVAALKPDSTWKAQLEATVHRGKSNISAVSSHTELAPQQKKELAAAFLKSIITPKKAI